MSEALERRLKAGLGGMAVTLLLMGLVVRQAQAEGRSLCTICIERVERDAQLPAGGGRPEGECYKYPKGTGPWRGCMQGQRWKHCYRNSEYPDRPCPDPDSGGTTGTSLWSCSSTDCRFLMVSENTCKNDSQAGTICSNECYAKPCGSTTAGTTCRDVAADPPDKGEQYANSLCTTKCGCQ